MAGSVNAGSIVYEVDMDTARFLAARREVDAALNGLSGSMGRLDASVTRTERSVASMERAMSSLSGVAKGVIAALSIQQVAQYGNEWVTVNNKLANSVRANESLAEVTQRVFDISQSTMSSLGATATLYGRLERATRSAGTSTKDLVTLTSTINKGLAVSGATTEEASSTMTQLSQALASGVLRGEEFNSISENGSRLAVALADSLGVTIGQLRAMAAQGKLTTEVVVNGLLQQSDKIAKEFANTAMTMGQAMTTATNNITKFVGESSSVSTTINIFNKGVISLSENLDVVAQAVGIAALVFGGRFVGALAMATIQQGRQAAASINQAVATRARAKDELAASLVTQRKTMADRGAAESAMNLALVEYQVAKGSAAEATALANVTRLRTAYTEAGIAAAQANNLVAASQARLAATGLTAANAMKAMNLVTSPLGGPLGVIAIVAAGWYLYAQRQEEARKASIEFASTLPSVISKLKEMNLTQAQGVRADTVTSIKNQKEEIADLESHIADLNKQYKERIELAAQMGGGDEKNNGHLRIASDLANELAKANRDLNTKVRTLNESQDALRLINIQVNQGIVDQMKAARDSSIALAEAEKNASFLGQTHSFLATKLGQSTEAMQKFNAESLKVNWGGSEGEKLIKQAERRLALSKKEGDERERLQATYDAEDAGVVDPLAIAKLQEVYVRTNQAKEAVKDKKKEDREATAESKKAANQAASVAQKLASLKQQSELVADSTNEMSRAQAILTAQQSLGKGATQADIQLAGEYAAKRWDEAAAIRAQAAALKLIPEQAENARYKQDVSDLKIALQQKAITQKQHDAAAVQMEQQHQVNLAKIRASQNAGVTPLQEAQGAIDPVQALANENAKKLELIKQFETEKGKLTQNGLMLRNAANTEYEQQRIAAQWEIFKAQSESNELLGTAIESLSGGASNAITGLLNGTQSLSQAFANLGTSVLNGLVSSLVEMGVRWVESAVMGQAAQQTAIASNQATAAAALATSTATGVAAAAALLAAYSPAAMAASVATSGGAAAAGLAGYTTAMTTSQAVSLAGMREHGGPVSASSMYRVGEGGKPEIFKASNGSQYMIPGDNGSVLSNRELSGSSSGGAAINQTVQFTINTTNGIDDATMQKMAAMMKQVSLKTMQDEQRPGGILRK
ncbi:hypothetical protein CYR55_05335 [Chimaeribacter californicus]|uniref:Tape measure protein N-terminal domain-containing protein n=1 Tax=Chimaeribacter californicus TaxID=2060067 RepID=A0A2N5EDW3_9GAMM|nr:tape measure protein [Chimaeribacter californicus]PLR40704.1 hypothetical protein CYR55_05335 [Chimaeribacter californicus]